MTTVNGDPFAALNTGTTGAATTAKKADTLGQADFMRLMTEQLANQDPLKPLSNSEFVAQLAQFSTVQGISDLNTTVNGFTASLTGDQVLKGASLVGHSVVVPSESLALPASGNILDREQNEKQLLKQALAAAGGNRTRAAELMGISRRTLHRKLLQWPELDPGPENA